MWCSALDVMAEVLRSRCVVLCTGVSFVSHTYTTEYSWRWAYRCPKHVELFIIINKLLHQVGTSRQVHKWLYSTKPTFVLSRKGNSLFYFRGAPWDCAFVPLGWTLEPFHKSRFFSSTNALFYQTHIMLKRTVKISLCLPLHVSVHLDHPQGAYAEPC
jgi:hypothetical protein